MCGIAGLLNLKNEPIKHLKQRLDVINELLKHRGPDGKGTWKEEKDVLGFGHTRLSIIDLRNVSNQPMSSDRESVIVFNGEIFNYVEIKDELKNNWNFKTNSDTETILAAYHSYKDNFLNKLRGMFSFALWDKNKKTLICARDRFGIKPFYYTIQNNIFYFASEAKALLPFIENIETDEEAFSEYITFQYTLGEQTLFKGIKQLLPGYKIIISNGSIKIEKYWDVSYKTDLNHTQKYFEEKIEFLIEDSIKVHLRSDVPVASYLSGGIDSSLIAILAHKKQGSISGLFHGKFTEFRGYDESDYALEVSKLLKSPLSQIDITSDDFKDNIEKVIYHLDFPTAGPGSFPQYMVSKLAGKHVKVILGGQGGDEIFGGYARYVISYFEQTIKSSINGHNSIKNYDVTPESIIQNLAILKAYTPLIKNFWSEGLFDNLDDRYFRLCDRSNDMKDEIDWSMINKKSVLEKFKEIFNNDTYVSNDSYFDKMTRFDFKCLLPALLQVEDRMSMASSIESRVPFLDHPLVELLATIPPNIKYNGGRMKILLKDIYKNVIPPKILNRSDKMGFPVPLKEWFEGDLKEFIHDIFSSSKERPFLKKNAALNAISDNTKFSRKLWGLLSLELWYQQYHDKNSEYKKLFIE